MTYPENHIIKLSYREEILLCIVCENRDKFDNLNLSLENSEALDSAVNKILFSSLTTYLNREELRYLSLLIGQTKFDSLSGFIRSNKTEWEWNPKESRECLRSIFDKLGVFFKG